jgi:GNAT superfamily N-acetyltransferase
MNEDSEIKRQWEVPAKMVTEEVAEIGVFYTRHSFYEAACTWRGFNEKGEASHWHRGTCSVDRIDAHRWHISRCLVQPAENRSRGVGSMLLQRAVAAALERDPGAVIEVCPGGYSDKIDAQERFYEKNGFVRSETIPDLFYYQPKKESTA